MSEALIDPLRNLGFTGNEAKAYLALLQCQPASAYEIAKQAGVPTSKIYETVKRLVTRHVFQARESADGTQQYHALDPEDLMASIRHRTENETEQLLPALRQIPRVSTSNLIWSLGSLTEIQAKTLELINSASDTLLISLWPEELDWCDQALRHAESRGVRIALVHFGVPRVQIGATYHHPVEKTLYAEKGGRGLTVVADAGQVVIANFLSDGSVDGAWSKNHSFVIVAEDYVKHDVYITKVTRFLESEMKQRFGEDYTRLRDVFDADA